MHPVSTVTEGRQMVPVLNSLNVQASVYGNHEFGVCLCMQFITYGCQLCDLFQSLNDEIEIVYI